MSLAQIEKHLAGLESLLVAAEKDEEDEDAKISMSHEDEEDDDSKTSMDMDEEDEEKAKAARRKKKEKDAAKDDDDEDVKGAADDEDEDKEEKIASLTARLHYLEAKPYIEKMLVARANAGMPNKALRSFAKTFYGKISRGRQETVQRGQGIFHKHRHHSMANNSDMEIAWYEAGH